MNNAKQILTAMSGTNVIILITESLLAAIDHSSDSDAWSTPSDESIGFQYAYSHVSYVCACLWSKHINDSVEAETFTDLLYNPPEDMEIAVRKLLLG